MTLTAITRRLDDKRAKLCLSDTGEVNFTLCGIRCRVWYGLDGEARYGYKRPLVSGFETVTVDALAAYIHRFQF